MNDARVGLRNISWENGEVKDSESIIEQWKKHGGFPERHDASSGKCDESQHFQPAHWRDMPSFPRLEGHQSNTIAFVICDGARNLRARAHERYPEKHQIAFI